MPDSRHKQWAEMVATGGADSLFTSYPEDAELAKKINELLRGSGHITEEQIKRDRQRFHQLPRRADDIRDVQMASPTKNVILNKAAQLGVPEALAEILDNIFDNFEGNPNRPVKLEVEIVAYPPTEASSGELVIHENSGGIPSERVVPLIQLGASDRTLGGIGAWGEGFKMAVFALGQEVEVFSSYPKEQPAAIYFPKGWLDPNHSLWRQWKVDIYGIKRNPPPEGTTIVRINHLHENVLRSFGIGETTAGQRSEAVCKDLAHYFGEVYSEKYHHLASQGYEVSIKLAIGDSSEAVEFMKPVKTRLRENLSFLPWLRPIRWKKSWQTHLEDEDRTARVEVTIYAGLASTENYSPTYANQLSSPGVEMWGNGRKFSLKGRITDESVGWGFTYGGSAGRNPTSGASYRRFTIVALFTADDSRDIPWAAPVKNDYNRRSEFYAEIQQTLAQVIRLYKDAHALLEFVLLPFSNVWTTYDKEKQLDVLFRDLEASSEFIQEFAQSRFGKRLLAFQPTLSFKETDDDNQQPTVHNLYGLTPTMIQDIVAAAVATKQSPEYRVKFLNAMFPALAKRAEIEEEMGLAIDEEFVP
jgi:hypothetical protein